MSEKSPRNVGRGVVRRALSALTVAGLFGGLLVGGVAASPTAAEAAPKYDEPRVENLAPAALVKQKLKWGACSFPDQLPETQKKLLAVKNLSCATITVPRDWKHAKDGNTITVQVSRVKAAKANQRKGIMLLNPGGPGGTGLQWGPAMALRSPDLNNTYDLMGMDPRGVGQSTPLICTYRTDGETQVQQAKDFAGGCLDNPLTPFITTRQTTLDMDFIRLLMKEKKLNYIGYSYGTWLGGSYAATFPSKTERFLLDSSVDMSTTTLESTWDLQPPSRDRQFQDMMLPYIARNDRIYKLGKDPMEIRKRFESTGGFDNPVNLMLGFGSVVQAMYDTSQYETAAVWVSALTQAGEGMNARVDLRYPFGDEAQKEVPKYVASLRTTIKGYDISATAKSRALKQLDRGLANYKLTAKANNGELAEQEKTAQEYGAFEAIRCQDGQWTTDIETWKKKLTESFQKAPLTGMGAAIPACAFWPAQDDGFPETKNKDLPGVLFVQSEFDAATAYEGAEASMKKFKKSKGIVIDNEGSHGAFPYGTECVDAKVLRFFDSGKLPAKKWNGCSAVPLPGELNTFHVGGTIDKNGKLRGFKMESKAVKEANAIVAEFRRQAGIDVIPTGEEEPAVIAAGLPVG
ncbi:MAG: alpha/beta hydrolase [Propionibacteriales bacterium]|nr:alpha/beta hydrolase [Propionibacteriales bacterium]